MAYVELALGRVDGMSRWTASVRGSKKKEAHGTTRSCIIGAAVVMLAVFGIRQARVGV